MSGITGRFTPVPVRRRRPPSSGLAVLGLCASLMTLTLTSSAAAARSSRGTPPSQVRARIARRLAADYDQAQTTQARYRATMAIFKAVHLAVVTDKGSLVQRGWARDNSDPFLYEPEVLALAANPTATSDLSALAAGLDSVTHGAEQPTATGLAGGLQHAIRIARAHPAEPDSFDVMLIDQLSRRGKDAQNLTAMSPSRLTLDPVQLLILESDLAGYLRLEAAPMKTQTRAPADPIAHASSAEDCGGLVSNPSVTAGQRNGVKWIVSVFAVGAAGATLKTVAVGLDVIHAFVMQLGLSVTRTTAESDNTHLGPASGTHFSTLSEPPGHVIHFGIKVRSDFPADSPAIACGPLAGVKFPKPGGVPDVPTDWNRILVGYIDRLKELGTVTYDSVTNQKGVSNFAFTPRDEVAPGVGILETENGDVNVAISGYAPFGNVVGAFVDLFGLENVDFDWTVEYHEPAAWHVFGAYTPPDPGPVPTYFIDGVTCTRDVSVPPANNPFDPNARWHWAYLLPGMTEPGHTETDALSPGGNDLGPAGTLTVSPSFGLVPWGDNSYYQADAAWTDGLSAGGYIRAEPMPGFSRAGVQDEPNCTS